MVVKGDCIFCKIIRKEIPAEIVGESNNFIAIKDVNPRSEGHSLVIPKSHYVTLLDIPDKQGQELVCFLKWVSSKLLDEKYGGGFNLVMNNLESAGQVVMHAHIHIIPRNEGDGLEGIV